MFIACGSKVLAFSVLLFRSASEIEEQGEEKHYSGKSSL
jgi:hypothetical protein